MSIGLGFGNILALVPLAEHIVKLTAVCMRCYGEAAFTQRLGFETEVILILNLIKINFF